MNKIKKTKLKSWLIYNEIEAVIFDLDDTLVETNTIFNYQKREFGKLLKNKLPNIKVKYISKKIKEIDLRAFKKYGSKRIGRWNTFIFDICKFFKLNYFYILKNSWNIFGKIYTIRPNIKKGAVDFLNIVNSVNIPMYLLTNSNKKWAKFKLDKTGLSIFFKKIYAMGKINKSPKDWYFVIKKNKLNLNKVLVVGDSLDNDILPAISIGINKIIWVKKNDLKECIKIMETSDLKELIKENR